RTCSPCAAAWATRSAWTRRWACSACRWRGRTTAAATTPGTSPPSCWHCCRLFPCPQRRRAVVDETDPVADWIKRWSGGDQRAAKLLFARYAERLTHVAEQHLSRKVAAREGGEDVVQSVFRTFFRRSAEGQFQIDTSAQLWRLLV